VSAVIAERAAPTYGAGASRTAAVESAIAAWLQARPGVSANRVTMPGGGSYLSVVRCDDDLVVAARDLTLLAPVTG